jgi:hypothetical protein
VSSAVRGIDGPVRAKVRVSVEPLSETTRSRVKIELDFEGHGIGTLLVPLVIRREAQKQLPETCRISRSGSKGASSVPKSFRVHRLLARPIDAAVPVE